MGDVLLFCALVEVLDGGRVLKRRVDFRLDFSISLDIHRLQLGCAHHPRIRALALARCRGRNVFFVRLQA